MIDSSHKATKVLNFTEHHFLITKMKTAPTVQIYCEGLTARNLQQYKVTAVYSCPKIAVPHFHDKSPLRTLRKQPQTTCTDANLAVYFHKLIALRKFLLGPIIHISKMSQVRKPVINHYSVLHHFFKPSGQNADKIFREKTMGYHGLSDNKSP